MTEDRFGSPLWLTDALQAHFGAFDLDWCAEPWSAVVPRFITKQMDVFKVKPRAHHGFGNHPYSKGSLIRFVPFARESVVERRIRQMTQLVPHYTAERWFKCIFEPVGKVLGSEYHYKRIGHPRLARWTRYVSEGLITDIIPIEGRLEHRYPPRYVGARESARFSSVVVRFVHPEAA